MSRDLVEVGARIRAARKQNGLSQAELAEKLGIGVTHLSYIENGKVNVGLDIFIHITDVLNTSADWLLDNKVDLDEESMKAEIMNLISDCSEDEMVSIYKIIKEIMNVTKG